MTKTTSYEISKKLKEAGFEDSYIYAWYSDSEGLPWVQEIQHAKPTAVNKYGEKVKLTYIAPAYDLETLLDALKQTGKRIMIEIKSDNWGINFAYEFNKYSKENESLADTAGKMWLMLKEKGVL